MYRAISILSFLHTPYLEHACVALTLHITPLSLPFLLLFAPFAPCLSRGLCQYADPVTDLLDQCGVFRARLFRESCVFHQGCYVKDLSRLGRDLHKTLILDNSPASYIFHPENAVSFILIYVHCQTSR